MRERQILSGRSSPEQRMNMAVVMREKWRLKMVMETSMISANTSAMTALSPTAVTAPSNTEWQTKTSTGKIKQKMNLKILLLALP